MDNNDSNNKSQQTGGLKLMTVFIAVLALHVVVIGGFTVYHLMSGGSTDADVTSIDKTHKATDGTSPDASQGDKSTASTPTTTAPTEVATIPANTPAPEQDASAPTVTPAPTPAPAPAPAPAVVAAPAPTLKPAPTLTLSTPKPAPIPSGADVVDEGSQAPSGPITAQATPAFTPVDTAPTPSVPVVAGPVHMPPAATSATAHSHEQIYVVKITDSYKKIAHAHHVTVAQLKEANHIKTDVLHTGQKLVIPSSKTMVATTTALDSSPSEPTGTETATPLTTNLSAAPSDVASTTLHHRLYTIVKGDTLIKIAHKFKTTTSAIIAVNSIADPTRLTVGKKLKIPSEESRSAKNSSPASPQPSQVQAKDTAPSAQLANFVP